MSPSTSSAARVPDDRLDLLVVAPEVARGAELAHDVEQLGFRARTTAADEGMRPAEELASLIEQTRPRCVLVDDEHEAELSRRLLRRLRASERPDAPPVLVRVPTLHPPVLEALLAEGAADVMAQDTLPALFVRRFLHHVAASTHADAMAKRLVYEQAVADCARLLVGHAPLEVQLQETVERLQRATGVSRAYLFQNVLDPTLGPCCSQRHEACAEGVSPQIDNPDLQRLPYREFAPNALEVLSVGRAFHGVVEKLPEPERSVLLAQDIRSILLLPIFSDGAFWGFMGFDDCVAEVDWELEEVALLQVVVETAGLAIHRKRTEDELYRLAVEDALTGLHTRRYALDRLDQLVSEALRGATRFALALIDIDHFKRINDQHGHLVGDQVLRQFGAALQREFRSYDVLGRYGGEEFVVVLLNAEPAHLAHRLRTLRERVLASPIACGEDDTLSVRFSAGVTSSSELERERLARGLLEEADRRLYVAKRGGRDRVVVDSSQE